MALRSLRIPGAQLTWTEAAGILLTSTDGEVAKDVQRRAYAVQKRMKRLAGYRYGTLRRGIRVESSQYREGLHISRVTSSAPHTIVHEFGRKEVTRGVGQVVYSGEYRDSLKFQAYRGQRKIFRNKARAVKATNFMQRSIDAALD